MANQTPNAGNIKEPKFFLRKLFKDADVVVEPEEPQKIVVAGLVEAKPKKEYPEGYIKKASAVFKGEYANMMRTTAWFLVSTLAFILVIAVGASYFEKSVLGGAYNFMAGIGIGYPGSGDSISESVASLYWDVYQPVLMMLAAAMIFSSLFMSGQLYAAKRAYYQDYYKKYVRTYFLGFAKYWWKYLLVGTFCTLVMLAAGTALLKLLSAQQVGQATAGLYCGVVFSFVFGAPLLLIGMVMCSLFTVYKQSLVDTFKNALVIIVNNPLMSIVTGIVSMAPLLICIAGNTIAIIAYIVMLAGGFNFLALAWISLADRGMARCKALKAYYEKKDLVESRKSQKNVAYQGNPTKNVQAKKKPVQPYQNPKKKKKK